ncbi:PilZ domain-containing protein [Thiomicrorhabdus chilensis]|uniref:PilZ domain-containing protein n=1 Tax=Thiomicrorhabdus chilensis TaxID=63656 RepID=UPI00048ED9DE|nr:PilZ domain-containing protein [Thiomicrorhabdus chilensis]
MMPSPIFTPSDKRQAERYPSHKASILMIDGRQIYTTIINFSASGVGILSAATIEPGTQVELQFEVELDSRITSIQIPIEIVRCSDDDDEHLIGAKLQTVTFEYRALLKKLATLHARIPTQ